MVLDLIPGKVQFIGASFVKAPHCSCCGKPMVAQSKRDWECNSKSCDERGKPVSGDLSRIYPLFRGEG